MALCRYRHQNGEKGEWLIGMPGLDPRRTMKSVKAIILKYQARVMSVRPKWCCLQFGAFLFKSNNE